MPNKKYTEFIAGTATTPKILLLGDPTTGKLERITVAQLLALVVSGGGDIFADGSVDFTGQETFGAGLKTDTIESIAPAGAISFKDGGASYFVISPNGSLEFGDPAATNAYLRINLEDVYLGAVDSGRFVHINENIFEFSNQAMEISFMVDPAAGEAYIRQHQQGIFGRRLFLNGAARQYSLGDEEQVNGGTRITVDDNTGTLNIDNVAHNAKVNMNGVDGASGTFTTNDGKTVTVDGGIITSIV